MTSSANSYAPWTEISPQAVAYSSAVSVPLSRDPSDSGYATRGSSTQPASFDDTHWSPKRSPEFSASEHPPKRNRTGLYGEIDHSPWPGSETNPTLVSSGSAGSNERSLETTSSNPKSAETEYERTMYAQRLDTLLAKVQKLKEATALASHIRKERSTLDNASNHSPDVHDSSYLPSVRIAHATATHFRELNKSGKDTPSTSSPETKASATSLSSELRGLEYHESEAETLSLSQQPDGERRSSLSATFGFESSEFSDRIPEPSPQRVDWTPEAQPQQEISKSTKGDAASGTNFSSSHASTDRPSDQFSRMILSAQVPEINYRADRLQCDVCHKYVKTRSELKLVTLSTLRKTSS